MRRIGRQLLVILPVGVLCSLLSAWLPMLRLSERTPCESCSRAWVVDDSTVGTVLSRTFNWWLPVDEQWVCIREGRIAIRSGVWTEGRDDGPMVYFTTGDTTASPIGLSQVCATPPEWYETYRSLYTPEEFACTRHAGGWPWRCVAGFQVSSGRAPPDEFGYTGWTRHTGYYLFGTEQYSRRGPLPYRPIWFGMLADTVFWTLVITALRNMYSFEKRVRGGLRRRGNRCASCGYDRTGLGLQAACPECGTPPVIK